MAENPHTAVLDALCDAVANSLKTKRSDKEAEEKLNEKLELLGLVKGTLGHTNVALEILSHKDLQNQLSLRLLHPGRGGKDDVLCRWLFDMYSTAKPILQRVVLALVPAMIWALLSQQRTQSRIPDGIYACLVSIYQSEALLLKNSKYSHVFQSANFVLPDLSVPSVYHTPIVTKPRPNALTESSLRQHEIHAKEQAEQKEAAKVRSPHLPSVHHMSTENTLRLLWISVAKFVSEMARLPLCARQQFCVLASRLSCSPLCADVKIDLDTLFGASVVSSLEWNIQAWGWRFNERMRLHTSAPLQAELAKGTVFCQADPSCKVLADTAVEFLELRAIEVSCVCSGVGTEGSATGV